MRKTALFTALLATLCLFAACSKDEEGVYNPQKKIAKVYESSMYVYSWYDEVNGEWIADTNTEDKTLAESWEWDGKKLAKITYYEHSNVIEKADPVVSDVVTFTYDGKKVTRAEGGYEYVTFTYDGKEIQRVDMFDKENPSTPMASFAFVHKDGKIVKINITAEAEFDKKASAVNLEKILFRNILPDANNVDKVVSKINTTMLKSGAKAQMTIPFELTWNGDNVSEMSATMSMYGFAISAKMKYTYDDKNNPYQNFFFGMMNVMEEGELVTLNKNNDTKMVSESTFMGQTDTEEMNYTYTYDGKWPVSRTLTYSYNNEDEGYASMSETINYFEYK